MMILFSFYLFLLVMVSLVMLMFMFSLFFIESYKFNENHDNVFECGFEPSFLIRIPFSIQFFQMTIVFLIFDIEIIMFLPNLIHSWLLDETFIVSMMTLIVLVGLIIEWYDNSLEWVL